MRWMTRGTRTRLAAVSPSMGPGGRRRGSGAPDELRHRSSSWLAVRAPGILDRQGAGGHPPGTVDEGMLRFEPPAGSSHRCPPPERDLHGMDQHDSMFDEHTLADSPLSALCARKKGNLLSESPQVCPRLVRTSTPGRRRASARARPACLCLPRLVYPSLVSLSGATIPHARHDHCSRFASIESHSGEARLS